MGVDEVRVRQQIEPMLQRFTATGVSERFRHRYLEHVAVAPAATGISDLRTEFSSPLRLLMAAVGVAAGSPAYESRDAASAAACARACEDDNLCQAWRLEANSCDLRMQPWEAG